MKELWEHQQLGKDMIYDAFSRGIKRVILWCATGGGKTNLFCSVIKDLHSRGIPVVLVMRRRALIQQASASLDSWLVHHGVYMAGHRRFLPDQLVQVCSIDTLDARNLYPHSDKDNAVIIVDESHDCTPSSSKYSELFAVYDGRHIIGFTATPFTDNTMFEEIVCPIAPHELRDKGLLVPVREYVPHTIDVSGVKIQKGEFNERELFEVSSRSEIVGDFVRDWRMYSQGRPTFLYAVNVEHSKIITEAFNREGIPFAHCDAQTKQSVRDGYIRDVVRGTLKGISSVNVLSVGVDVPEISCIQLCRVTLSLVWQVQAIGRGVRACKSIGKQNCIIIDNAANTLRHGSFYKHRDATIGVNKKKRNRDDEDINIRRCVQCMSVFEAKLTACPYCGYVNPRIERKINQLDGELAEYHMTQEELEVLERRSVIADNHKLKYIARMKSKHDGWAREALIKKYGIEKVNKHIQE